MQHETTDGIVIRTWDTGEHDRMLWVLTAERGRLPILTKGAKSVKSDQRPVSQIFSYSNFEYYRRGNYNILKSGSLLESFYGLHSDINAINLAFYLCEVTCDLTEEGEPAHEVLRLLLNALYALSRKLYPHALIKGAYEMRLAMLSGYAPELSACAKCERTDGELYLDVSNGALVCSECLRKAANERPHPSVYDDVRTVKERLELLTPAMLAALRYIENASPARLFAFSLQEADDLARFERLCELYLLTHLDREFKTLDFYRSFLP